MRTSEDLTTLLNQSGFPMQMAVERLISSRSQETGWRVLHSEYGWVSPTGQEGFVDLVLEDRWRSSVVVAECKRVRESEWIFLSDAAGRESTTLARLWISNTEGHGKSHRGFFDLSAEPASPQAMFCVVPGQDPKSRPMLERVAAEVLAATESIALEEHPLMVERKFGIRMYASMIITTAKLISAVIDTSRINLASGELTDATYVEVPWIRFRKAFSSERAVEPVDARLDFDALGAAKEKLVFVVNVMALDRFLTQWGIENQSLQPLWYA
jgi:hypothetical protein